MQTKSSNVLVDTNQAEKILPLYVTDKMIKFWKKKGFALHYLPPLNILKTKEYTLSVSKIESLMKTVPKDQSYLCPGRWVLIEEKRLLRARVPWIDSQDIFLLTMLGLKMKNWLQKCTVTKNQNDPFVEILIKHSQYSRFCMTRLEVDNVLGEVCSFLKLPKHSKVRLPHYVEYAYLAKNIYPEWVTNKTWEWLEDKSPSNKSLATGYKTWNIIGYDPPDFWSTILGFRVVVEI